MASERNEGEGPDELWAGTAPTPPVPPSAAPSDDGGPPTQPVPPIGGPPPEEALRLPPNRPVDGASLTIRRDRDAPAAPAPRARPAEPRPHARRPTGGATREMLLALVIPGVTTMRRAFVLGFLLVLIGIVFPLFVLGWMVYERDHWIALGLDDRFLLAVMVGAPAALIARFVAVTEVAVFRSRFHSIFLRTIIAYALIAAVGFPIAVGVQRVQEARDLFAAIFPDRPEEPLFVPTGAVASDEFANVLLLGSDAGPDRFGDRTDSIVVVTIHRESGRTGLISVPRNLVGVSFPAGSAAAARWPGGFPDLVNAMYPVIAADPNLHDGPAIEEVPPAAIVVARALGQSLGVQVDDVVFTDMAGFMELIDVLGGVTVDVEGEILLPPNIIGATNPIPPTVGPGPTHMDGATAVAYARARYADSDYARMGRQRQLLAALASQTSVFEALWRLPDVSDVLQESLATSTSREGAVRLVRALGGGQEVVESVGLVPPLVNPGGPNWDRIRQIVFEVQVAVATGEPSGYTPVPEPLPAD